MTSKDWLDIFPFAKLYNLKGSPSDHSVLFLEPKGSVMQDMPVP